MFELAQEGIELEEEGEDVLSETPPAQSIRAKLGAELAKSRSILEQPSEAVIAEGIDALIEPGSKLNLRPDLMVDDNPSLFDEISVASERMLAKILRQKKITELTAPVASLTPSSSSSSSALPPSSSLSAPSSSSFHGKRKRGEVEDEDEDEAAKAKTSKKPRGDAKAQSW